MGHKIITKHDGDLLLGHKIRTKHDGNLLLGHKIITKHDGNLLLGHKIITKHDGNLLTRNVAEHDEYHEVVEVEGDVGRVGHGHRVHRGPLQCGQ